MNRYIVSNPKILNGKPVIAGTRIPVDHILLLLKEGFTVDAIHQEYPQISTATISGTVSEAAQIVNKNASKVL